MNITRQIEKVLYCYRSTRGQGYTTLLRKLEREDQVSVLVNSERDKQLFQKAVSISKERIKGGGIKGPLLMDNKLILDIFEESLYSINTMEKTIEELIERGETLEVELLVKNREIERLEKTLDKRLHSLEVVKFAESIRWNLKKMFSSSISLFEIYKISIGKDD